MLTLGGTALLPNALPNSPLAVQDGNEADCLSNLLATPCRGYDFNTGGLVQLVSWLVAMHARLLLEHRLSTTMFLAVLRPGAGVLAIRLWRRQSHPSLRQLWPRRAVDGAGVAAAIAKTETRAETALSHCPRLVFRTRQLRVGEAAIMVVEPHP